MAAEEIETFMNGFDDDGFVEACNQLEECAGTKLEKLQDDRSFSVTGQARHDDTRHGSSSEDVCSESQLQSNSVARENVVKTFHVGLLSEGNAPHNDETSAATDNKGSIGLQHGNDIDSEGVERSSRTALTVAGQDVREAETRTEEDGSKSRKKRRKSKSSDDEDDVVERYMRKSDQKYAFNKADPDHPPLLTLRHGHLAASDFAALMWCEQQYVYKRTIPSRVRREKIPEPEYVAAGSVLHRERELAIQTYVKVETTSLEDNFSLPYSNTLLFMRRLLRQEKPVVREVRVMAKIDGVLVCGIIDELRVADVDDFAIDLVEFKTRNSKTLPRKSQKETHDLQMMLYKYMFDDMIRGRCFDDHLAQFGLDIDAQLGEALAASIQKSCTSHGGTPFSQGAEWTVRRLFEELRLVMQALPFIRSCFVNYTFQGDSASFHECEVAYDEGWLLSKLSHGMSFWKGERGSQGVDVEEAWKCRSCPYQEHCWWVRHKSDELQRQNQLRHGAALSEEETIDQQPGEDDTQISERTGSPDAISDTTVTLL